MTDNPTFHIGDILTLVTRHPLSPTGISAIQALCDHIEGRALFVYEMPGALRECGAHLRAEFPALAALTLPHLAHQEDRDAWVAAQAERFGELHEVRPIVREYALTATSKES